jgi:hypothetical protein
MSQLVGQPCSRCGQPLFSVLSGTACPGCGKAVHHGCLAFDEAQAAVGQCPRCGGSIDAVPGPPTDRELVAVPHYETTPESPFLVPDLRKRTSWRKKLLLAVALLVLGGVVVGLGFFGFRWLQRSDAERMVRKSFEDTTHQGVTAIHLERQDDGNYAGTITTTVGEEWDVQVWPSGGGRPREVRWLARPPIDRVERELRKELEKKFNKKVISIKLARQADGRAVGTAELQSGEVFDIRESGNEKTPGFTTEWTRATVEKWVREVARQQHDDVLDKLELTRHGTMNYTGKASGASGLDYRITIAPIDDKKHQLRLHPLPESLPRWVKWKVERQMKLKVAKVTLTPHPEGYSSGQLVTDKGLVYDVRAGVPPAWRKDHRADLLDLRMVPSPSAYAAWIKDDLQRKFGSKVRSLRLEQRPGGKQVGIARLADRTTLWVTVVRKRRLKEGEEELWPDLPDEKVEYSSSTQPPRE